jgi:hypothetical protein
MFSVITNIYNKKTKGPTINGIVHSYGKTEHVFRQLEIFDVCTTGDTAKIDTIFKFLPHTRQHGCIDILHRCNDPCLKARISAAFQISRYSNFISVLQIHREYHGLFINMLLKNRKGLRFLHWR